MDLQQDGRTEPDDDRRQVDEQHPHAQPLRRSPDTPSQSESHSPRITAQYASARRWRAARRSSVSGMDTREVSLS